MIPYIKLICGIRFFPSVLAETPFPDHVNTEHLYLISLLSPLPLWVNCTRSFRFLYSLYQRSFTKMASANVLSNQTPVMPKSHVGFDSITTQIERKLLKRGFQFNIICVGESNNRIQLRRSLTFFTGQTGLGKSTLINTIFASHLIDSKGRLTPSDPVRSTTEIQAVSQSRLLLA